MARLINNDTDLSMSSSSCDDIFEISTAKAPQHETIQERLRQLKLDLASKPQRVSFASILEDNVVMSRHDYTMAELRSSFYSREEFDYMKFSARLEGKMIEANSNTNKTKTKKKKLLCDERFPSRGLELQTRAGYKRIRKNRFHASAAVFYTTDNGGTNSAAIADSYSLYSRPCADEAYARGRKDALEALRVHREACLLGIPML